MVIDDAELEAEKELQLALERARRAKVKAEKPVLGMLSMMIISLKFSS